MKKILFSMALLATVIFTQSCSDEPSDDPKPVAKTKTELLTSSGWIAVSGTVSPAIDIFGIKISDFYAFMDDCDKDDIQIFKADKTGIFDEGATKCDPMDSQTEPFAWSFLDNETKIIIDGDTADLMELTETTLKVSTSINGEEFGEDPPVMHTIVFTYRH